MSEGREKIRAGRSVRSVAEYINNVVEFNNDVEKREISCRCLGVVLVVFILKNVSRGIAFLPTS